MPLGTERDHHILFPNSTELVHGRAFDGQRERGIEPYGVGFVGDLGIDVAVGVELSVRREGGGRRTAGSSPDGVVGGRGGGGEARPGGGVYGGRVRVAAPGISNLAA